MKNFACMRMYVTCPFAVVAAAFCGFHHDSILSSSAKIIAAFHCVALLIEHLIFVFVL